MKPQQPRVAGQNMCTTGQIRERNMTRGQAEIVGARASLMSPTTDSFACNAPQLLACLTFKGLPYVVAAPIGMEISRQSGRGFVLGRSQAAKATWRDGAAPVSVALEIYVHVVGARKL